MDRSNFTVEQQRHLTRLPSGVWAYVPPPLPPAIDTGGRLAVLNGRAERALGHLGGVAYRLPDPYLLIGPFSRREAVLSSRIEGTVASLTDLVQYEARATRQPSGPADVLEVSNYVRALNWGLDPAQELPVSKRLIRGLHGILMANVRGQERTPGQFRTYQNHIGRPGSKIEDALYVPPPPVEMSRALDEFEEFLHGKYDLPDLIRLALIHYQFEAIHPFGDGNGRVGRLLISLLLVKQGIISEPMLYLSAFFDRHRPDYYELLLRVSTDGDWPAWIAFFLEGVEDQATDAVRRATELLELREEYRSRLMTKRGSAALLRLVDEVFGRSALTIPRAKEVLDVTPAWASRAVERLVEAGIVSEVTGRERYRIYLPLEILRVLERDYRRPEETVEQLPLVHRAAGEEEVTVSPEPETPSPSPSPQ